MIPPPVLRPPEVVPRADVAPELAPRARVFFGGPERPRRLRDLLEERVEAVPAGGEILWVTYYFRDGRLAGALARAHRRGVAVKLVLEGAPRLACANDAVIRRLRAPEDGIGAGLRVVRHGLSAHLHEKLYCFSHPRPVALVGSFNPSGDEPEDPAVIRAIGDQDRGHNVLVELAGPEVARLAAHARWMHAASHGWFERFGSDLNEPVRAGGLTGYFFPRRRNPLSGLLRALPEGARLRVAASHLSDGGVARRFAALAGRGVGVELIAEATLRRVPRRIERELVAGGVRFRRYVHPCGLPMHNKFVLAEASHRRWAAFGSYNFTAKSRWLNHELLFVAQDDDLFAAFAARWDEMVAELAGQTPTGQTPDRPR